MATPYDVLRWSVGKIFQAAGFEVLSVKTAAAETTLAIGDARMVATDTTSAAFTLYLPASPYDGMQYTIYDAAASGSWNTNNLTIDGNGNSIVLSGAAPAATVTASTRSGSYVLRYYATSDRWHQIL